MNSEYLKVGSVVHISTAKSHLPQRNFKVLEVHPLGVIVQNNGNKNGPINFVGFHQVENMEITSGATAEKGVKTTAGVTASRKAANASSGT